MDSSNSDESSDLEEGSSLQGPKTKRAKRGSRKARCGRKQKAGKKSGNVKQVGKDSNLWSSMDILQPSTSSVQSQPSIASSAPGASTSTHRDQDSIDSGKELENLYYITISENILESQHDTSLIEPILSPEETSEPFDENECVESLHTIEELPEDPFDILSVALDDNDILYEQPVIERVHEYLLFILSEDWNIRLTKGKGLHLIYVSPLENAAVTRSIFWKDGKVKIFIHNKSLPAESFIWDAVLGMDPLNAGNVADHLYKLTKLLEHSFICSAVRVERDLWQDAMVDNLGSTETIYEETDCFRDSNCSLLLLENKTCAKCRRLKTVFQKRSSRRARKKTGKCVNNKYLSRKELKEKAEELQKENRTKAKKLAKLRVRIKKLIARSSVNVSQEFSDDVCRTFQQNHSSMTDVQKIFWSEQMQAISKRRHPRTVRWNPFVIKIALHLQMISQSAYNYMQNFIALPSARTLYDFTHIVQAKEGAQDYIIEDLQQQLKSKGAAEHENFFALEFDEITIKSDIVISKKTGEVIGYTNLSSVEAEMAELESEISNTEFVTKPATKALVYLAQGITTDVIGIVGIYATDALSAAQLYSRTWHITYSMENSGLKVLCLICDGASMNKKFFKMNASWDTTQDFIYATVNLASCDERRPLFFIPDPPHILKTVRNCLANSYAHKKTRKMWKDNENLSWKSIELLYEITKREKYRSHKLTRAHIHLTSYACMKVLYATQVMSSCVSEALLKMKDDPRFQGHDLDNLARFLKLMNDAFDCWNSHGATKGKRNKKNPLLAPYTRSDDPRFKFLKEDFLGFFQEWQTSIQNRPGNFKKEAKERMFISQQSYESLKMAVFGFEGAIKYMIDVNHAPSINGRKFNQDKLEQYFGVIRMSGGGSDNPTMQKLLQKNISLHIQGQAARPTQKGNTEVSEDWVPDQRPLMKRKRK